MITIAVLHQVKQKPYSDLAITFIAIFLLLLKIVINELCNFNSPSFKNHVHDMYKELVPPLKSELLVF